MSQTLGYTTTPTGGTFSATGSATDACAIHPTVPAGAGIAIFDIHVHIKSFGGGAQNAWLCVWNASGTLLASPAVSISSNQWYSASISPFVYGAGGQPYIGMSTGSGGYTAQYDSTGTSYQASNGTAAPSNCGFGLSGFGYIGAYVTYNVAPSITSFTPSVGGPGTSVTITGTEFTTATSVDFNGTAASFTVNSDTQITATVPSGATTGVLHVVNPIGTATSSASFTVASIWINTGTPASPTWTSAAGVVINTGTPASPTWTQATQVAANTGTPASPVWTPGG